MANDPYLQDVLARVAIEHGCRAIRHRDDKRQGK